LVANGNLCERKLTMPTEFVAQNGAEIQDKKNKAKRQKCETAARKRYGKVNKKLKKKKK
jgi:hypothetical protein